MKLPTFNWQTWIMALIFVIAALYIVSEFTGVKKEALTFELPGDIDKTVLNVYKIIFLGVLAVIGFGIATKLNNQNMGRADAFKIVLLLAAAYFLWPYISQAMSTQSLDKITFAMFMH